MDEPRPVVIAEGSKSRAGGYGLKCAACGAPLIGVEKKITTNGFVTRKLKCSCGHINVTDERVIGSYPVRPYNRKLEEQ